MKPAISVHNIGKRYCIDHASPRGKYKTLRESVAHLASAPLRRLRGADRGGHEDFWALKDVSFDVQPGEVVGIIGRNGAGKSTLLKILSRIAKPTCGEMIVRGRVGSLLEVGTGFHPELTGRENIYLNGSILGMRRAEIEAKFDEIVDFSGVERFLDTPVKRYSSGMQVRLAFAVAAHLEPEILVVDEVLAVGDISFQNKCLARMQEVTRGGRTVLFVSHNMTAVQALCSRAILLADGTVVGTGDVPAITARFIADLATRTRHARNGVVELSDHPNRRKATTPILQELKVSGVNGSNTDVLVGAPLDLTIMLAPPPGRPALSCVLFFCAEDGQRILALHSKVHSQIEISEDGPRQLRCRIPELPLLPRNYRLDIAVASSEEVHDYIDHATDINVLPSDVFGTGALPSRTQGFFAARSTWTLLH